MSYRVEWIRAAEDDFARIWRASPDRTEVARASIEVVQLMRADAAGLGESREPGMRVAFQGPLVVSFWVNKMDRRALILHVRANHRRV